MKKLNVIVGAFLVVVSLLCVGSISAQNCKIEIVFPKKGAEVRLKGPIRGTALVPPGMHLWVFVQKEGQHNWWPQGGGSVKVKEGKWVVDATYGDENHPSKDVGNFDITAVVLDDEAQAPLNNYIKKTEEPPHEYPGVELPAAPSGGCSIKEDDEVTVTRK